MGIAKIWEEEITIPTYKVFPPEKNPLFLEKRAYQGSTGKVYPLAVTEKISDVKEDQTYHAVFLENDYIKVMVLPELGGRIQRAYDKTNGYDFVYYNEVIKPALVGLTGPWISGGIEFNWPQHHRPSTYAPQDYCIRENEDGSVTVFISEIDKMYGTKGEAAISLYPDKAYIEIRGQLYNHNEMPQTFLWWANPAVAVNDDTYSVFPPDVNAVMDHGKRAVSTFPIATGEYYKQDYSAGVDISRYKNIHVPTSYMAAHSDFDFIGNYDEGKEAGLIHVADHHISPGKKQWTWGNGDFGRTWDDNLTDENGPYIELMTGMFCDNQPDFTWLKPHEEKNFVQYFMPYKKVGRVSNATKECVVGYDIENGRADLRVYATGIYEDAHILVKSKDEIIYENTVKLSPEACFEDSFATDADIERCLLTVSVGTRVLVKYKGYKPKLAEIPKPAEPMALPVDVKTNEDLWLCGMHLEQYRHATYEPADYYEEGLRRDPNDIRINISYGQLLLKRGKIEESVDYFRRAIAHQTMKNPNPYFGDGYYYLGIALSCLGREEEAFDAFYKATWSEETKSNAFYWLAAISCRKMDFESALSFVDQCLIKNWHDVKARNLKSIIMRRLGIDNRSWVDDNLKVDPLYMGFVYEKYLKTEGENIEIALTKIMREDVNNYLELALDYIDGGFYEDALKILQYYPKEDPMQAYYMGFVYKMLGGIDSAIACITAAEEYPTDYNFPAKFMEVIILENAIELVEKTPKANLYLGNLYYDKKQYGRAAKYWLRAIELDDSLSMAHRNLAIYTYNKLGEVKQAVKYMEKAVSLDSTYPRNYLELDQLYARANVSVEIRLAFMEDNLDTIMERDDLCLRYITLLNCKGKYEKAVELLKKRRFHPWEGGEGKVIAQYKLALINLAKQCIDEKKFKEAIVYLNDTLTYPRNLGEGKLPNVPDNISNYYLGVAYAGLGKIDAARKYYELATIGSLEPASVLYYNDQPSDYIYFIGLAYRALCDEALALKAFHQLTAYGQRHMFDKVSYDFFAVSLPEIEVFQEDIQLRNEQYCCYLRYLGALGVGDDKTAEEMKSQLLKNQADYQINI